MSCTLKYSENLTQPSSFIECDVVGRKELTIKKKTRNRFNLVLLFQLYGYINECNLQERAAVYRYILLFIENLF